jgi:hypothetical protein
MSTVPWEKNINAGKRIDQKEQNHDESLLTNPRIKSEFGQGKIFLLRVVKFVDAC